MKCCARLGHIRIEVLWAPSKCWGWRKDCEHNGEHNIKGRLHWVFLAGSCKRQAGWFNRIPFHHTLGPPPSFLSWCWSTGTLWKQTRGSSGTCNKESERQSAFCKLFKFLQLLFKSYAYTYVHHDLVKMNNSGWGKKHFIYTSLPCRANVCKICLISSVAHLSLFCFAWLHVEYCENNHWAVFLLVIVTLHALWTVACMLF